MAETDSTSSSDSNVSQPESSLITRLQFSDCFSLRHEHDKTNCSSSAPSGSQTMSGERCHAGREDTTSHEIKADPFSHAAGQHIDASPLLTARLAELYDDETTSDLQLHVAGRAFYTHKLILTMSSDVMRVMLTRPEWPDSQHASITLSEEACCVPVFEGFLRFLYTGRIRLTHTTALPLLMLADKYNVLLLRQVIVSYMVSHVVSTVDHCRVVPWYQYARLCGHRHLASVCENFILCNFHKVMCTADFVELEASHLCEFLSCDELVLPSEHLLYLGVLKWLEARHDNCTDQEAFYEIGLEILKHVRFLLMSSDELQALSADSLTDTFQEFVVCWVRLALCCHKVPMAEWPDQTAATECRGTLESASPRHYTCERWANELAVEHYCHGAEHEVRQLFFSTPTSSSEADDQRCWDWTLDIYPKGVFFDKCILLGFWRNLEVGGKLYHTVRATIKATPTSGHRHEVATSGRRHVEVALLVWAVQDGVQFVAKSVHRRCTFDDDRRMYNLNDIVPYDELNCENSPYMCGENGNTFKITVIVKPVMDV